MSLWFNGKYVVNLATASVGVIKFVISVQKFDTIKIYISRVA
jgi:uncharacterized membrane protein YhfC